MRVLQALCPFLQIQSGQEVALDRGKSSDLASRLPSRLLAHEPNDDVNIVQHLQMRDALIHQQLNVTFLLKYSPFIPSSFTLIFLQPSLLQNICVPHSSQHATDA